MYDVVQIQTFTLWFIRFLSMSISSDSCKSDPHYNTLCVPPAVVFAVGDFEGGQYGTEFWLHKDRHEFVLPIRMPTVVKQMALEGTWHPGT